MTSQAVNISDDLRRLVDAALDETIERADWNRLCDAMRADADVRRYYIARRSLHAGLMWETKNATLGAPVTDSVDPPSAYRFLRSAALATAATLGVAAAIVAVVVWVVGGGLSNPSMPAPRPIAVLTGSTGSVLTDPIDGGVMEVGAPVVAGGYELGAGRVEVAFGTGVEAAITGPARFRFDSPEHTTLTRGRLTALARPGYTVATPRLRVVDLGTAFTVDVDETGATRVECYRGKVRVETLDETGAVIEAIELTGWRALTQSATGAIERSASRFAGLGDLPGDDPMDKLVAWYPFEGDSRNATDDALHASDMPNVTFAEGRHGSAAVFDGTLESYIDLPIDATPESMPRLTWGAWVKPTALDGGNREVLSTDNMGFRRALTLDPRDGTSYPTGKPLKMNVGAFAGKRGVVASTGPAPEIGAWRFVAAVYDASAQTVTVYTDDPATGELIATTGATAALVGGRPVIRVGNHATAEHEAFAGAIDDVFVIAEALTENQMKTLFREGIAGEKATGAEPLKGATP